jgi:hypothetical protein
VGRIEEFSLMGGEGFVKRGRKEKGLIRTNAVDADEFVE